VRMVKEFSGTVAKIACAVNVDDAKDRKKAEKLRRESNKGKRDKEHKKRQQKRFDTLANRQKADEKAKEEASRRVKEAAEKTVREEAGRLTALEDLQKKQQEIFKKGKQSATPKEMETNVEEQKKVQAQINKIESQQKVEKEVSGGKGKWAVGAKRTKMVKVNVIHQKPVDIEIRRRATKTTSKIIDLWKEETVTEGRGMWTLLVAPGRERKEESVFEIGKVPEDVLDKVVVQKLLEGLKADGWTNELAMWIFLDASERVKVRLPMAPVPPGMGRAQMREELQKANGGIAIEGRLPEVWGKLRNTGIEFSVSNIEEAKKAVFKGVTWNGHKRRVEVVTGERENTPIKTPAHNRGPRPQAS